MAADTVVRKGSVQWADDRAAGTEGVVEAGGAEVAQAEGAEKDRACWEDWEASVAGARDRCSFCKSSTLRP